MADDFSVALEQPLHNLLNDKDDVRTGGMV